MVSIISEERFLLQCQRFLDQYESLRVQFPDDERFLKLRRNIRACKSLYRRDKVYVVRMMNLMDSYALSFSDERRSFLVRVSELLQKLILEKKLKKPTPPIRRRPKPVIQSKRKK